MKATQMTIQGKVFNVEKRNGEWQTNYRDAKATTGKTEAEAVQALKEYNLDKLLSACNHMDTQITRDNYVKDNTEQFTAIFGFTPPRDFLMYACGYGLQLDVIALDKKLRTPDGISTNDYILANYGQYALEMVKQMI